MKILPISSYNIQNTPKSRRNTPSQTAKKATYVSNMLYNDLTNKALINFNGYFGDKQPIKKLYAITSGNNEPKYDNWTNNHIYEYGYKKWINAAPNEVLKRTPAETIDTIMNLTGNRQIPERIETPNIGGKNWGRTANYIEINPRLIAKYENGVISDGLLNTMKLMTLLPPSSERAANCIILSQLYPSLYGDGTTNDETLYHVDLHRGISKNLTARGLDHKMGDDEQVKAFNDLAHLLGFKTGIRMPLSEGQLRIKGKDFSWLRNEQAYIDACAWAIDLGFDSIYLDSGKHVVNINGYCGIGAIPNAQQMSYILRKIKEYSGRSDLSFIGEKCSESSIYSAIGFNAGTDWSNANHIENVKYDSRKQASSETYAAGPDVSNDNDNGEMTFDERLNRLNSCLFGYDNPKDKLPAFMQINDILPLSPYINTHQVMEHAIQMDGSEAWTECERHLDGVFRTDENARKYTQEVYKTFSKSLY